MGIFDGFGGQVNAYSPPSLLGPAPGTQGQTLAGLGAYFPQAPNPNNPPMPPNLVAPGQPGTTPPVGGPIAAPPKHPLFPLPTNQPPNLVPTLTGYGPAPSPAYGNPPGAGPYPPNDPNAPQTNWFRGSLV